MKVFIDVSNLMHVNFISGIQRVVREVVTRLAQDPGLELVLLEYRGQGNCFGILSLSAFQAFFRDGEGKKEDIRTGQEIGFDEFPHGSVFLELDSVWHSRCKRMTLYPALKARGVKIAVCYQDLIPIMWPQYAAAETICAFLGYMTACVTYGDLFISSTRTNIQYLQDFMRQIGVENPAPCAVSWLGTDFKERSQESRPAKRLEEIAGRGKYLLMVGTVEPRKNHRVVLDAMEQGLFARGWQLVIAGRQGWDIQETAERIRGHELLGRQLHWIEDATDADIEYLYTHSRFVVFPSLTEGFGLPVVEALGRGIPVLCSDHPVLKEVGGEYCRYFPPGDPQALSRVLEQADREQIYGQIRETLQGYKAVGWDQVAQRIAAAIQDVYRTEETPDISASAGVKQMVMLSARAEDFLRTLPFIERFMPFIGEIVLCCPDAMEEEIDQRYRGGLWIRYLTDSVLLDGCQLPADHAARNIFLRARAIQSDIIDPVFLMSDDDYRPLRQISVENFYKNGRYQAYYVGDLRKWKGTQGSPTSFDSSMWKCRDFLMEQGYSTYMFDAHMPQIINRRLFLEMLKRYPQIAQGAASEWSGYFNYLASEYPGVLDICPYVTMDWPGFLEDWNTEVKRPEYLFENFYDLVYGDCEAYRGKGHFTGFSREYTADIPQENRRKAEICRYEEQRHEEELLLDREWRRHYRRQYGVEPVFAVCDREGEPMLRTPAVMPMLKGDFLRMDFRVMLCDSLRRDRQWQLTWTVWSEDGGPAGMGSSRFQGEDRTFQVLLMAPEKTGTYQIEWSLYGSPSAGAKNIVRQMKLEIKDTADTNA